MQRRKTALTRITRLCAQSPIVLVALLQFKTKRVGVRRVAYGQAVCKRRGELPAARRLPAVANACRQQERRRRTLPLGGQSMAAVDAEWQAGEAARKARMWNQYSARALKGYVGRSRRRHLTHARARNLDMDPTAQPYRTLAPMSPEWFKLRQENKLTKLSASKAAMAVGLNQYGSTQKAYRLARGLEEDVFSDYSKRIMQRGLDAERAIVECATRDVADGKRSVFAIMGPGVWLRDIFSATPDAFVHDAETGAMHAMEVKCPQRLYETPPLHYLIQLQLQLYCAGLTSGFLAAGNECGVRTWHVDYDAPFLNKWVVPAAKDFLCCVASQTSPGITRGKTSDIEEASSDIARSVELVGTYPPSDRLRQICLSGSE